MLKTTKLSKKLALKVFKASNNEIDEIGDSKANKKIVDLSKFKKSKNNKFKSLIYIPNIEVIGESTL